MPTNVNRLIVTNEVRLFKLKPRVDGVSKASYSTEAAEENRVINGIEGCTEF